MKSNASETKQKNGNALIACTSNHKTNHNPLEDECMASNQKMGREPSEDECMPSTQTPGRERTVLLTTSWHCDCRDPGPWGHHAREPSSLATPP